VALRDAGVTARIHVLGPIPPGDLDTAHAQNVEVTLWDAGTYAAQLRERRAAPPLAYRSSCKNQHRRHALGLSVAAAPAALQRFAAQPEYLLAGVFSHLAAAEELDSTFTRDQLAAFQTATASFDPAVERHIAASAAAMLWPQTRLDAIRAGIAIYGIWPSRPTEAVMHERGLALVPALTWQTQIVVIQDVPAGNIGRLRLHVSHGA